MLKIIKRVFSIAMIPVQLYFGYLVYKNFTNKQNSQVNQVNYEIINKEINVESANGQNSSMTISTERSELASSETAGTELPKENPQNSLQLDQNHPKVTDLTPERTVNGLTIGKTTASQAMAALGQPLTIHQNTVYIYENINLYFQNNTLIGYAFPGTAVGFSSDTSLSPFKTASGLTLGTPMEEVFKKYGPKELNGTSKIIYQDRSNGYVLNISHKDNKIIAIEVGKQERRAK